LTKADLISLVSKIIDEQAIEIKDRKYHFKTYSDCFLGNEFIDYLIKQKISFSVESAIELGNHMIELGLLSHVCRDHLLKYEGLFYRFTA